MIRLYNVHFPESIEASIGEILRSGSIAYGPNVELFEEKFREYIGNPLMTSSGAVSSSIKLSLFMAGVRPGDEVIASPLACLATNIPVRNLFGSMKWCDIDPTSGNLDPKDLAAKVSSKTKAILVYHWAGNPVDLGAVYEVAHEHGIPVVEDASEALSAELGGNKLGNTGSDYTVFSFYPNRHLTTIEGGAITFKDPEELERCLWLKRYGIHLPSFRGDDGEINPRSDIPVAGWNTCLNHVAATIGVAQLPLLDDKLAKFARNGEFYDSKLKSLPSVDILTRPAGSKSAYWVYTLLSDRRDEISQHLRDNEVQTSKVHLRNDVYSCFGDANKECELPGVDEFSRRAVSIPCGWWVSEEECERIASLIAECLS